MECPTVQVLQRVLCALLEKPHCQQNAKMFYFETIIMVALWDVTPNIEIIFGEFTFCLLFINEKSSTIIVCVPNTWIVNPTIIIHE